MGWRSWLLGIGATILATLILNGIAFQRDARKDLSENAVKINYLEQRSENTIKYISFMLDERTKSLEQLIQQLDRRLGELEKKR